jgi:hypothetical protein
MRTITGLYDTFHQAKLAVEELEDAGIPSRDISIVAPGRNEPDAAEGAVVGAGVGAAVGGAGGLLAGLSSLSIPGIGPAIGAGWLITSLLGAAAGGAVGGLLGFVIDEGVEERDAHVYAEAVRRGRTLVLVRIDETEVGTAKAILSQTSDPAELRREFEADGWAGFSDSADPWDDDAEQQYRRHSDEDPIITPMP